MLKYITTTLPYCNSIPHLGHLLEFLQADVLVRHYRLYQHQTFLNVGIDTHGQKMLEASEKMSMKPDDFINIMESKWKHFCEDFHISYNNFYNTNHIDHYKNVSDVWERFKPYLYTDIYEGKYCKLCEENKTSDVCEFHPNNPLTDVREFNYFFKLADFKDKLIQWIEDNPNFLKPKNKKKELLYFIENISNISISRENLKWGIAVPNHASQTIYVWFEALLNYVFAIGEKKWEDAYVIQICGVDNIRFQGQFWQAMLMALGLKNTNKLLVHGTILDAVGHKMSKSLNNVVNPSNLLIKYPLAAIRYYMIKGLSTYKDSHFDINQMVDLYNNEVVNIGNLFNRVLHLAKDITVVNSSDSVFIKKVDIYENKFIYEMNKFNISVAYHKAMELVDFLNKYINDSKPWESTDKAYIVNNCIYGLNMIVKLYEPLLPNEMAKARSFLTFKTDKSILFNKIEI